MPSLTTFLACIGAATASMPGLWRRQATLSGIATFNDFATQSGISGTVCGAKAGVAGTFAAAAGDISPDISGGLCQASIDPSQCAGQSPIPGYVPPSCPTGNCGLCYSITNQGGFQGAASSGVGQSIIVQIVDSCPSTNAQNFCKTDIPAEQRCGSSSTNSMDIDQSAYVALTGVGFIPGLPNLSIQISPVSCPGS